MLITKEFKFDAAHFLPDCGGKCEALHGHTYKLQVAVCGKVGTGGIVMDFKELAELVHEKALSKLDHINLNDVFRNPSCENIAMWIWEVLHKKMPKGVSLYEIKLWEGESSFATYHGKNEGK